MGMSPEEYGPPTPPPQQYVCRKHGPVTPYMRVGLSNGRQRWLRQCRECYLIRGRIASRENAESRRELSSKWYAMLKTETMAAYGGECYCCGERDARFLTIDHINGGGIAHRKNAPGNFYRWLKRHGWPDDGLGVACYNCNCAASRNKNVCPHKEVEN